MTFTARPLTSQQVQQLIDGNGFQTLQPNQGSADGPSLSYSNTLPGGRNTRESVSVVIRQAQMSQSPARLNVFSVSVRSCGGAQPSCSTVQTRAERASQELNHQRMPLDGLGISGVLYGDANHDGLNDVLVRFSDGTGTLYQASAAVVRARSTSTQPHTESRPTLEAGVPEPQRDSSSRPQPFRFPSMNE